MSFWGGLRPPEGVDFYHHKTEIDTGWASRGSIFTIIDVKSIPPGGLGPPGSKMTCFKKYRRRIGKIGFGLHLSHTLRPVGRGFQNDMFQKYRRRIRKITIFGVQMTQKWPQNDQNRPSRGSIFTIIDVKSIPPGGLRPPGGSIFTIIRLKSIPVGGQKGVIFGSLFDPLFDHFLAILAYFLGDFWKVGYKKGVKNGSKWVILGPKWPFWTFLYVFPHKMEVGCHPPDILCGKDIWNRPMSKKTSKKQVILEKNHNISRWFLKFYQKKVAVFSLFPGFAPP